MAKLKAEIEIDCESEMCGKCTFLQAPKCKLFEMLVDHIVCGELNNSGSRRHSKCIDAEVEK